MDQFNIFYQNVELSYCWNTDTSRIWYKSHFQFKTHALENFWESKLYFKKYFQKQKQSLKSNMSKYILFNNLKYIDYRYKLYMC